MQTLTKAIKVLVEAVPLPVEPALAERAKAAAELLESIGSNRALLAELTEEDRTRLLKAAGHVSRPDAVNRRQLVKATKRQRKAARVQRLESVLDNTGIRKLRREPVFTSPNVHPPIGFEQKEVNGEADFREVVDPQNCY